MLDIIRRYGLEYKEGELHWYGVRIRDVVNVTDTPVFIFSADEFRRRLRMFKEVTDYKHLLCFSIKSNSNPFLISEVVKEGYGVDVVSGGELFVARKVGVHPKKIVFSGVGKTDDEIRMAQKEEILLLNVESESEYRAIKDMSKSSSIRFGISFRVKFEMVLGDVHSYLRVGNIDSKFGMSEDFALELYEDARRSGLPVVGVHFHLGSQIRDMRVFAIASERCQEFLGRLEELGVGIRYVDVGGGLGMDYENLVEPSLEEYVSCFRNLAGGGRMVIFEIGRFISAPSGLLVARIIRRKEKEGKKRFLVVDAGMNELMRIPLYGAFHKIIPVSQKEEVGTRCDIVGPICENSDYIAQDIEFPELDEGELICVLYAGAYTSTMLSNYNGRPSPPEVIISGGGFTVVRRRQSYQDLLSRYEM